MYGFVVMAKGAWFEFYLSDGEQERDAWVDSLKPSVVLLDLKEDFDIFELLGRGNFAKVHLCQRKKDPNGRKYALKTIEKNMIKQSRRNVVSIPHFFAHAFLLY